MHFFRIQRGNCILSYGKEFEKSFVWTASHKIDQNTKLLVPTFKLGITIESFIIAQKTFNNSNQIGFRHGIWSKKKSLMAPFLC